MDAKAQEKLFGGAGMKGNNDISGIIEKIQQEAVEKYKKEHGWIPVTEAVPEGDGNILLSIANYETVTVGRYEEDELGGAFYLEGDDIACSNYGLFVNA